EPALARRTRPALSIPLRPLSARRIIAAGEGPPLLPVTLRALAPELRPLTGSLAHPRLALGALAFPGIAAGRAVGAQPHVARGARGAAPPRAVVLALGRARVTPARLDAQDAAPDLAPRVRLAPGQLERAVADADQPVHLQPDMG